MTSRVTLFVNPDLVGELGSYRKQIFHEDGWALVIPENFVDSIEFDDLGSALVNDGPWQFLTPAHMIKMVKYYNPGGLRPFIKQAWVRMIEYEEKS